MIKALIPLLAVLSVVSCVPATPQARIERSPEKYAVLSEDHKARVQRGEIVRGMSPDAVFLAWGSPAQTFQGSKNGQRTERWDYAGSKPVYTTSFYGSYGYHRYGPYRRRGYYGFGPEVTYVPYRIASVWFMNSRVDSWERAR